ncbi:carbamoyl-phosphate synthase L chain, ATP binding domain-containing protein [Sarocladium implicatum]|nr:carbamoyl-phosphate synthase L chain, ATP binding domain-containing protein [Sarocladium implicatum]
MARHQPSSAGACPTRAELFVAQLPETDKPIRSVLIANRGEIACRVIATCRKLNIRSIAVYVEEDIASRHVLLADESICLGSIESKTLNPFLDAKLLVKVALESHADVIHPGYGYLSENGAFATLVRDAGMIFIGPTADAMNTLGDKRSSKAYLLANAPDIPLIPGFSGESQKVEELEAAAAEIGFPVMLKASAGGGGKGMRVIWEKSQLSTELERARSEAQRFFGSSDCILEKYIKKSKHVEVQVMGDQHGTVVSFFERECSIQRRHQKVIEESPCSFLTPEKRKEMSDCAVRIAKLISYENAGTVEFVLDVETGRFYFLEVNARLQVEHPITEEVTGFDLVSMQLYVAAGGRLTDIPEAMDVKQQGHAIECRLCAEDPKQKFFPDNGTIHLWQPAQWPLGPGRDIRYETAVESGSPIAIYFDPMIAKLIVWAPTRKLAIAKMANLLADLACIGIKTNQSFMRNCLLHPAFEDLEYTTNFIPDNLSSLIYPVTDDRVSSIPQLARVIPSLLNRHGKGDLLLPPRSFRSIGPQFRNQRFDKVNLQCDIITASNDATNQKSAAEDDEEHFICLPEPHQPGSVRNTISFDLVKIPRHGAKDESKDAVESAAAQLTSRYNKISNMLRSSPEQTANRHIVHIRKFDPIDTRSRASQGSAKAVTLEVAVNKVSIRTHCVVIPDPKHSQTQKVICQLPQLGQQLHFESDSLLSFVDKNRSSVAAAAGSQRTVKAPMPCKILSMPKQNGDDVELGETVMVIESMKMEVSINASAAGRFESTRMEGQAVNEGHVLCEIKE